MFKGSSIFVLVKQDKEEVVKLLEVNAEAQDSICDIFANSLKELKIKTVIDFDGNYKADDDDELLVINEFRISDAIIDAIKSPLSVDTFSYDQNDTEDISAVFVGKMIEEDGENSFIIAFQKFVKKQSFFRKLYRMLWDKDTFIPISKSHQEIGVRYDIDCFYADNKLYFKSYYYARQIFDLTEYYREAMDSEVNEFSSSSSFDIEHPDKFVEMCDTHIRKKIASINDSGVLKNRDGKQIKELAQSIDFEIEIKDNKISIPNDKKRVKEILRFLDDEVYKGTFSEKTYMTNSKRIVPSKSKKN